MVVELAYGKKFKYKLDFDFRHPGQIMDVIEMTFPYQAVLTACLDGKMRCFQNQKLLWIIGEAGHAAKSLDHSPHHGGSLL